MHDDRRYFQRSKIVPTCERQLHATFCLRHHVLRAQFSSVAMIASTCVQSVHEIWRCCDNGGTHDIDLPIHGCTAENIFCAGTREALCDFRQVCLVSVLRRAGHEVPDMFPSCKIDGRRLPISQALQIVLSATGATSGGVLR